jgi:putative transposase
MPRKARVLVSNCPHHIVQRGHNRKAVFIADEDYRYYLKNLYEWKNELNIKLYESIGSDSIEEKSIGSDSIEKGFL